MYEGNAIIHILIMKTQIGLFYTKRDKCFKRVFVISLLRRIFTLRLSIDFIHSLDAMFVQSFVLFDHSSPSSLFKSVNFMIEYLQLVNFHCQASPSFGYLQQLGIVYSY